MRKTFLRYSPSIEFIAFLSAIVAGMFLSWFIISIWPVSYESIARAKELGIVSPTILNNYPKQMEVVYYLIFLLITPLTAVSIWFCYRYLSIGCWIVRKKGEFVSENISFPIWGYVITAFVAVYLTYYQGFFTTEWIEHWYLLGEQGENLSWARGVLRGNVLYKDSFVLYGPLMEYPLALMMYIFGETVFVARVYSYLTYALTAVIIGTLPFSIFKARWQAAITSLILLTLYFPEYQNVNATPLRIFLGILAIFVLYRYTTSKNKKTLIVSGILTGVTLLYSQEMGLSVILAVISFWLSTMILRIGSLMERFKEAAIFFSSFLAPLIPFFLYFHINEALIPFIKNVVEYPSYVMLGYGSLPGINIPQIIISFFQGNTQFIDFFASIIFYFPVLVYAIALSFQIILYFKGRFTSRDVFFFMITIYGIISYRSFLGRSDILHALQVYAPSIFLVCYLAFLAIKTDLNIRKTKSLVSLVIILIFPLLFLFSMPFKNTTKRMIKINTIDISKKFSVSPQEEMVEIAIPEMKGIYIPKDVADTIIALVSFSKTLEPNDSVYVYGNYPFFYFILNRRNPTRFDMVYWAATTKLQNEIVDDLKRTKPKYMIYSVFYIDNILPDIQVPVVHRYIAQNYSPYPTYSDKMFTVYTRKDR